MKSTVLGFYKMLPPSSKKFKISDSYVYIVNQK